MSGSHCRQRRTALPSRPVGSRGRGVDGDGGSADWAERRRRAIDEHGAALERRKAAETAQARELIAGFLREARERGLPTTPLTARGYGGRARYRTGLRGWYLVPGGSVAIGDDGGFYALAVPDSWRARFVGARVAPQDPPLIVGEGGRDGESSPLSTLLRRLLDVGPPRPG
jgi:hypothetical protein